MTWCYPGGCRSFLSSFPSTRSVYCDEIFNSSQSFSSIDQKTLLAVTNTAVSHHSSRSLRNVKKQMVKLPNTIDFDEKGKNLWGWILVYGDRVWNFQTKTGCIWQSVPFMVILGSEMTKLWISILKH